MKEFAVLKQYPAGTDTYLTIYPSDSPAYHQVLMMAARSQVEALDFIVRCGLTMWIEEISAQSLWGDVEISHIDNLLI